MKFIRIVIAVVILAVVTLLSLRASHKATHFWSGVPSDVTYNGKRAPHASVLLGTADSAFDMLLIDARRQDGVVYVVNLTSHEVNELRTGNYRYTSSRPSASALKPLGVTATIVDERCVEFTTPYGARVRVRWMANA